MKTINTTGASVSVQEEGESYNDHFGPCHRYEFKTLLTIEMMDQGWDYEVYLLYRITSDGYIQLTSYNSVGHGGNNVESQYKTDPSLSPRENLILAYKRRSQHRMHFEGLGWLRGSEDDFLELQEAEKVREELIAIAETKPESDFLKFVESTGREVTAMDPEEGLWRAKCPGGRHHIHIDDNQQLWYCGYDKKGGGRQELLDFIEDAKKK